MSVSGPITVQRVNELVTANQVIRAPYYHADHDEGVRFTDPEKGLQWGADVVPAMMGLFRVEKDTRGDHPDGWVGFARHWRGGTMRLDFDMFSRSDETDSILVVTAISGREGEQTIVDEDFGEIELSDQVPTQEDWGGRQKRYQAIRRDDTADGSAAVHAYIAALPGWNREIAARFDEIVRNELPHVRRAVKYHQPFYGVEDQGWFASFSAFSKHVKLTFVCETYLEPKPPSGTGPKRQALDLKETDTLDEEQVASWVQQAAADPGMGW
ncbi:MULTISPECIES: DUF1801 domain-containing protein [unclassified Haladaptatus]|uniref:DUF1801 domain-containing protein n=1 Tax=unclassified Haladaptatus TaxID=2622732 RepID=UPI00209C5D8E|nr:MULTISPECIES: DUF1801 domain-containing protein [unclassified Haladaptatus]MCO8243509.1 DUF1801 domain-containing protein [Haladaptatus sp. AB643]MCO8254918.1 DUF1801 domain-containing protein [Haladaptatus sp. AB618]